jgi:sec-independent protein translocase protein TatA
MGFGSIWHWILVLLVLVLLFGAGKISGLMGDVAKGIKSFKKEMASGEDSDAEAAPEPEPAPAAETKVIEHKPPKPALKSAAKPRASRAKAARTAKAPKST